MLSNIEPLALKMTVNICRRAGHGRRGYWGLGGTPLDLCCGSARGRRDGRGGYQVRIGAAALPPIARKSRAHKPQLNNLEPDRRGFTADQDFGARAVTMGERFVLVLETLRLVGG
jgi:hypothetical protein